MNRVMSYVLLAIATTCTLFLFASTPEQSVVAYSKEADSNVAPPSGPPGPFVSGEWLRSISDHVVNDSASAIHFGNSLEIEPYAMIFVKTDFLSWLPKFQVRNTRPYILVNHDSAYSIGGRYVMLTDNNLVRWFSLNKDMSVPNIVSIPLGIANSKWPHGNQTLIVQKMKRSVPFSNRLIAVYVNHAPTTNAKRAAIADLICKNKELGAICRTTKIGFSAYLTELGQSRFVISPPGMGIDRHRTWESLAMGAIPIVLSSSIESIYKEERILVVDDYNQVTRELLDREAARLNAIPLSESRIYRSYWIKEFAKLKKPQMSIKSERTA